MSRSVTPILFLVVLLVSSFATILQPVLVSAVSGDQFRAGRIIDDPIFNNSGAMSTDQIQQFLNAKVPTCDNWGTGAYAGTTRRAYSESKGVAFPLTCLKDYYENITTHANNLSGQAIPSGAISAAQIIHDVGTQYNVNPQALIVLLQKEQNLILDDWPWPRQFQIATGYGCPDTAACDSQYYGFYNQVSNAAKQFRRYAASPQSFNYVNGTTNNILFNPNSSCGSSGIYISTQATAALYNYTPYQPNAAALTNLYGSGDSCSAYGNRNFWRFFNDWFGTTSVGTQPSPLYKSNDDATIYAVAGGKKYPIPSYGVLVNYGFQKYPVAIVDASFLTNYTTGKPLTSIAKKADDPSGTLYFFDDGKRYPISINDCKQYPDGTTVANSTWALDCFNSNVALTLPNQLIDNYTVQDISLPQVILFDNAPWKIEDGKKRRITNSIFVDVLGGWDKVRWMKDLNASQPLGQLLIYDKTVVKFNGDDTIYTAKNSTLYPIPSMALYSGWGLTSQPAISLPASYNAAPLPVNSPLKYCAQATSGEYFLISSAGTKVSLSGQTSNWNLSSCTTGLNSWLSSLPTVANTGVYRSESGMIFTVQAKQKLAFPTMDDFFGLGFSTSAIINVPYETETSLGYAGMSLANNRLFKVTGDATIRLVQGNTSLSVNSTTYPGLAYNKLITVDSATGGRYPINGTYQP